MAMPPMWLPAFGDEDAAQFNGMFGDGFGDPSDVIDPGMPQSGFGDNPDGWFGVIFPVDPQGLGAILYPDDGGLVVTILGDFKDIGPWFRVKVKNTDTNTFYPLDQVSLRSALADEAFQFKAELDQNRVRFALPPLPRGPYDIYLYWDAAPDGPFQPFKVSAAAFTVVFRHRRQETWMIRNQLPPQWKGAGPRAITVEPMLGDNYTTEWPAAVLQTLTDSLAEEVQLMAGKALTRLTADFLPTDATAHVETTLGFPLSGQFYTGGSLLYNYTGVTAQTFTGCTPAGFYQLIAAAAGTIVTAIPNSWKPLDNT